MDGMKLDRAMVAGASDFRGLSEVDKQDSQRLRKACQGVEALFLNMMLKEMRKSVPRSGLFPDSLQRDIYTSLFDQHVSQTASEAGKGIGIADMLYEYLSGKGVR